MASTRKHRIESGARLLNPAQIIDGTFVLYMKSPDRSYFGMLTQVDTKSQTFKILEWDASESPTLLPDLFPFAISPQAPTVRKTLYIVHRAEALRFLKDNLPDPDKIYQKGMIRLKNRVDMARKIRVGRLLAFGVNPQELKTDTTA